MRTKRQCGSVAVECVLVMPLLCMLLVVMIQFCLTCMEQQLVQYAAVMAARRSQVGGDALLEVRRISPWLRFIVNDQTNTLTVVGRHSVFSMGLQKTVARLHYRQFDQDSGDNPICSPEKTAC